MDNNLSWALDSDIIKNKWITLKKIKEDSEWIKTWVNQGVIEMISDWVPWYLWCITELDDYYHLNPLNPNEPLKWVKFEWQEDTWIINDNVDITGLKFGDIVLFEVKDFKAKKIGLIYDFDFKDKPVIVSIKKVEKNLDSLMDTTFWTTNNILN
jgi:hypothetical protein